jgi:hypothetical protein
MPNGRSAIKTARSFAQFLFRMLTFMLTTADADKVCSTTGQLHRAVFPGLTPRRTLYISEQVRLLITGSAVGMDQRMLERWLTARAVLEAFVDGNWIKVKSKPKSRAQLAILVRTAKRYGKSEMLSRGRV